MSSQRVHFPGLDSLRFFAAFFVVLEHVPLNQESVGLPHPSYGTFFFRGLFSVCFFFTLSGFLITYLLLDEARRTGTIRVGRFYLRRVCRIWPLYFAVVAFGLVFYNALLPRLGMHRDVGYQLGTAAALYAALLPNLMNSLYSVGGILNPTWSIGVEEQFYLIWAPVVKRLRHRLPLVCGVVLVASFTLYCFNYGHLHDGGWRAKFLDQLHFHFMAAGGLTAWALQRRRDALLRLPVFTRRVAQVVLLALLADLFLTSFIPWNWVGYELVQMVLYCWLIVEVAANPRRLLALGSRALERLGEISYGIYMLHMPVVYATSALFLRTTWWRGSLTLYLATYYALVFTGTWLAAWASHRFYERPFLRFKERRFTVVPTAAGGADDDAGEEWPGRAAAPAP